MTDNKIAGTALIVGPLVAIVFFLFQPGALLIDPVEAGDAEGTILAYAENSVLTKITAMLIAVGLLTMIFGQSFLWTRLRDDGYAEGMARFGFVALLVGGGAWILVQGARSMLADTEPSAAGIAGAEAIYAIDAGMTTIGALVVSLGFVLMSIGLIQRGGAYKTTGIIIAVISAVAFVAVTFGVAAPSYEVTARVISRACYFPWTIWSIWLGLQFFKEPQKAES